MECMEGVCGALAPAASREDDKQPKRKERVAHSVTLTYEASNTEVLAFHVRTAIISRRAQKAKAAKETKRLKELEKLAVKVAKAATEILKTSMSGLAPNFAQEKKNKAPKE